MPFRTAKEFLTLREALNWIAFDDTEPPSDAVEITDEYKRAIERATHELLDAACSGDILGFAYYENPSGYVDAERDDIDPRFWLNAEINFEECYVKSGKERYLHVSFVLEEFFKLWPLPTGKAHGPFPAEKADGRRGPKERFSEAEFLAFCVWEAHENALPLSEGAQAKLIRRMQELLAVAWGEDRVPSDSWMKPRVSLLYRVRERYEHARQQTVKD